MAGAAGRLPAREKWPKQMERNHKGSGTLPLLEQKETGGGGRGGEYWERQLELGGHFGGKVET